MLKEHVDELFTGLKILRINIPYSKKELLDIASTQLNKMIIYLGRTMNTG